MRHAIYYDNRYGRNDGPPLYYYNVLKNQLNLDVQHLLPIGDTSDYGKFDYHWWIDWGEDGLIPLGYKEWDIPKDGGKTIYVASDTHIDDGYRLEKALKFDYVFFNQKKAFDEYLRLNVVKKLEKHKYEIGKFKVQHIEWLPHAFEPQAFPRTTQLKKYDVGFIGHVQDTINYNGYTRIQMLDRAFKEFPNFYFGTRTPLNQEINMFEDAARKFAKSRVVLNVSIKDDLNMRLFEVMGSGAFLLTNWLPTLEDLFVDGKHLVTYTTLDDMVEKIKYYLEYEEEREKIAFEGHKEVMRKHTYRHRVEKIMDIIKVP